MIPRLELLLLEAEFDGLDEKQRHAMRMEFIYGMWEYTSNYRKPDCEHNRCYKAASEQAGEVLARAYLDKHRK